MVVEAIPSQAQSLTDASETIGPYQCCKMRASITVIRKVNKEKNVPIQHITLLLYFDPCEANPIEKHFTTRSNSKKQSNSKIFLSFCTLNLLKILVGSGGFISNIFIRLFLPLLFLLYFCLRMFRCVICKVPIFENFIFVFSISQNFPLFAFDVIIFFRFFLESVKSKSN